MKLNWPLKSFVEGEPIYSLHFCSMWVKGKVVDPAPSWKDYTSVDLYEHGKWLVPTKNLRPGLPYGFGIALGVRYQVTHFS